MNDAISRGSLARYERQMLLPAWGEVGQRRLGESRVGVVGCGGLGAVIATHLVRAGVGFVRLIDADRVSLHNLHRQVLYAEKDVGSGQTKAEIAAARLTAMNSQVEVQAVPGLFREEAGGAFAEGLDLLLDGTDNFATRFAINRVSLARGLPWIYGGVLGATGMTLSIFPQDGPCLRCLFPQVDEPGEAAEGGSPPRAVVNTVVTVVASLQVTEAYKILLGDPAASRDLLLLDLWDGSFTRLPVERDPACTGCAVTA